MKIKLVLLSLFVCLFFVGCSNDSKYMENTTIDNLKTSIENKESFIVEIMSDTCSACVSLEPKLKEVLEEYEINIKKINTSNFSDDQLTELTNIINYDATPTIIFIKDGEELSTSHRIVGNVSKDKLISKFKAMGYIKEDN